ncbi:MAG: DNA repair and recombination protein RadA [archaeon]
MEESEDQDVIAERSDKADSLTNLPGVGAATAEKLYGAGYADLLSVAVATPGELVDAAGVSELVARKMITAARDSLDMGFKDGNEVLEQRKSIIKLTTGSKALDKLMGGGFESKAINEVFGQYGSGKTQLAHTLAVGRIARDDDSVVVFIDTESTFRPERIIQIAEGRGLDPTAVLKRIKAARAYNSDHQMLLAEKVEDLIRNGTKVGLIIVDSLTAHFRAEFVGRGTLADRQQKLNKHMHTLMRLAESHNIIVYVTNQVMAKPDQFFGDPTEAIGGHIVAHNSTFRLYLRRGKKGSRVAKLVDSPSLEDSECVFFVDEKGIRDE